MAKTIGLVLAGGQSSRMGQDKARLIWQNIPLYQHMQNLLHESGVDDVLLSGAQFGRLALPDIIPGKGPLSGIHGAIAGLPDGVCLLVVPVDMPLLPAAACKKLVSSLAIPENRARQVGAVMFEAFTLPLVLTVNSDLRTAVESALSSQNHKDYSLRRLFDRLQGVTIPLPDEMEERFQNTNTPEEWQTAKTALGEENTV
ncbi:molybdenum cofactor guanylyltransferase [Endozoicomonas arenosclerae]|uniref:molybdenum cofactor guanylyltransferase n=1 Tax=Endozoicomonas arenosclerae TaxID=1633495 RepID=UPI0007813089|nr:molybdenum cofactor guanylyltransferase [Endozoicomonas arenosclerae]